MINVENLKPFPKFCYTIGMIPTSYKVSLTYEEQLMWFCDFLQNTVIPTVNNNGQAVQELQNLYIELKSYVDNYFENLDVQEEINKKLDAMVKDGTLQQIITSYLEINGVLAFNTVADMKNATNLINGSFVKTYGFYSYNDNGGAYYKIRNITNQDLINETTLIPVGNENLVAELILENIMNVKQFGAYGDNIHNDTNSFNLAFTHCKNINIPSGEYLIDYFSSYSNSIINGENSIINCLLLSDSPLCTFRDNSTIRNLTINSLNEDREWNRIDLTDRKNITIENLTITGFRHNSELPNAWGIYMKNSENIKILNCKFDNNSQSDIAILEGAKNIIIDGCKPLNNYFHINLEPNNVGYDENVSILNCIINYLTCEANTANYWQHKNLLLNGNIIDNLKMSSAIVSLINNDIKQITTLQNLAFSNKILINKNSLGYEKELINDMCLNAIQPNTETQTKKYWIVDYTTSTNLLRKYNDNVIGKILQLNYNFANEVAQIKQEFDVTSGEQYSIDALMNTIYPIGSSASGRGLVLMFYNNNDELLSENDCLIDRYDVDNSESNKQTLFDKKTIFITVPENAVKMRIRLSNSQGSKRTYCTQWGYIQLHKINLSTIKNFPKEEIVSVSDKINNSSINIFGDNNSNIVGDFIKLTDGIHFGALCIQSGQPGTFKYINLSD